MGIRMVRQPSETPNVTNIDDIIPFRYAYGNQDGYVIGRGTELSYTIDGSTFRVNSGRVVLQGVETDIDANGVSFTIDNASETRYYSVYYEVNLATQTTAIKLSNYSTSGLPSIDAGDDLTANSSGIARMLLYTLNTKDGVIKRVTKYIKPIYYYSTKLADGISEELRLVGYLLLTGEFQEVASVSSGIFLKFTFSNTEVYGDGVFDTCLFYCGNSDINITKQLSTCHMDASNIESAIGNNLYVQIKYENNKIYMRACRVMNNGATISSGGVYLKGIYEVSGVEYGN